MITLIPSVPHTGTWFTIEFLRPLHDNEIQFSALRKNPTKMRSPEGNAGLVHGMNLVHGHIRKKDNEILQFLASCCPTIIPLRDPLAALITRQNRHPEASHLHIVDAFVDLVEMFDPLDPHYLPIDLLTTIDDKYEALKRVLAHMGSPKIWHAGRWAQDWPLHNSRGEYPLKRAYEDGDLDTILKEIRPEWRALRSKEPILRPFFEKHGYEGLLWYGT